jgi:hypothetical protein
MKRIMVFLTLCLLIVSCGTEEVVVAFAQEDNLVSNTALRQKVMRVAQHPTTIDDFIDECSCFSVKMPYTLLVGNDEVTVSSEADYQQVYDMLNASNYDFDFITFMTSPITVIYADYHEEDLNILQFMDAVEACSQQQAELSCVDLVYPVGIKTYDSQNVLAQSFEVGSKEALHGFLNTVDTYAAAVFNYPLDFQDPDNNIVPVNDNEELETTIDTYADDCGVLYPANAELINAITTGTWHVSYFYNNGDLTYNYNNYNFTFNNDGSIAVTGSVTDITGYWTFGISGGYEAVTLYLFSSYSLYNLEQVWLLTNATDTQINLYLPASGTNTEQYLEFTKN